MSNKEVGFDTLHTLSGDSGIKSLESLRDFSEDLAKYVVEFAYGEIHSRDHFTLREKELLTLSSLLAQPGCENALRFHYRAALNIGMSKQELIEIIIHCLPYVGFPKAMQGIEVLQEILQETTQ
ncbi:carboxymuconolactone decarboxylase family protein [Bacillus solimangrovi]|uniref:Carboxymuconolactone decarboxylase-like domain-containing protein n=1 Tax=Bacillus solimangrovi TaxID=1305675 RepID=A0A1E5LDF1_9BACI|nr:carboxymuconolactone decarboxylase family protein [Bacillus solimangrovi]OEH92094.1 hypothetical protein BFG57_16835 [Bacillus solimangrovi]